VDLPLRAGLEPEPLLRGPKDRHQPERQGSHPEQQGEHPVPDLP
jgi:hypothetical protein